MNDHGDLGRLFLRNKLLGRWAAERLGLPPAESERYSETLAKLAFDSVVSDVFSRVRADLDRAGIAATDAEILAAMTDSLVEAGRMIPERNGDRRPGPEASIARRLIR